MIWSAFYIGSVVLVNWGFSNFPGYEWFWSLVVGSVFITRDIAQQAVGKWWVLVAMGIAGLLSYVMADPFVAVASIVAFVVSEGLDWLVYTVTKRPLEDRILVSSTISVPADSIVFLGLLSILSPGLLALQIGSKMVAAVLVWLGIKGWLHARQV